MKKRGVFHIICAGILMFCILVERVVPETGRVSMFRNIFAVCVFVVFEIVLTQGLMGFVRSRKMRGVLLVGAAIAFIGLAGVSDLVDTAKDMAAGPRYVTLYHCDVEWARTMGGLFFGSHYYIHGSDQNGEWHKLKISAADYNFLRWKERVTILCYENTGRILRIEGAGGR